ncbi:MAG: shikimate kinase [Ruminiclostridium sp.]|nr:shikimate kinase [Ruminiclostridium sp.]
MKNIYLCGFMGCGKSHIGRLISDRLNCTFVDLDSYIEEKEGMTIPQIFDKHGEPHFRKLEEKYICEMPENSVVATGGGAIINPVTAESARKAGAVVFLDTDFELCYERIKGDTHRPLVMKNTKEQLLELFNKRREIYLAHSEFTVNSDRSDKEIAAEVIEKTGL